MVSKDGFENQFRKAGFERPVSKNAAASFERWVSKARFLKVVSKIAVAVSKGDFRKGVHPGSSTSMSGLEMVEWSLEKLPRPPEGFQNIFLFRNLEIIHGAATAAADPKI